MNMTRDTCNAIVSQSTLANTALRHSPYCFVRDSYSFLVSIPPSGFDLRIFRIVDENIDMDTWHPGTPSTCWSNL